MAAQLQQELDQVQFQPPLPGVPADTGPAPNDLQTWFNNQGPLPENHALLAFLRKVAGENGTIADAWNQAAPRAALRHPLAPPAPTETPNRN